MPNFAHEKIHGRLQGRLICGVDEVGRGPLAGPVVAAAAIIPLDVPRSLLREIRDSKKMSAPQREALFTPLTAHCPHAVAKASIDEIAGLNILWASMLAMQRAIAALNLIPEASALEMALIDGNRVPAALPCRATAIVKGDDKSLSIATASIIAKVTRDREMAALAVQHPGYGWERNAGYGTPEHLAGLRQFGVTVWHRQHFAPVAEILKGTPNSSDNATS
jgi:ribonuclease HII